MIFEQIAIEGWLPVKEKSARGAACSVSASW